MIRPTARAALLLGLGLPVALALLGWNPDLWPFSLAWATAVGCLIVGDAMMIVPQGALATDVDVPSHLSVGQSGRVAVSLTTAQASPLPAFDLLLEISGDCDPPALVRSVAGTGTIETVFPLLARRRGQVRVDALWLRWRGPMGFAQAIRRLPLERTIDVLPDIRALRGEAPTLFDPVAPLGEKAQARGGEGLAFEALREHTPGLDSRHIAWKQSARHRKLLGREFRTERNDQIILAFDTGYLMSEPLGAKTRLDHALEAGLRMAFMALRGGDLVGQCSFDAKLDRFLAPGRGLAWFPVLLRASTSLPYTTQETNFTLVLAELGSRLRRRSLVVLFTEFSDPVSGELLIDGLKRMAARHLVICVTLRNPVMAQIADAAPADFAAVARAVIAAGFARERAIVLDRVARLGISCLDVAAEQLPEQLIGRYLTAKRRGQV